MKKLLFLMLLVCVTAFTGCGNDDDENTYDVTIENKYTSTQGTTQIKAITDILETEIASTSTNKQPVIIKLPAKVAAKHLTPIYNSYGDGSYTISDPSVKWTGAIYYEGYNDAGENITGFYQVSFLSNILIQNVYDVYADGSVTVKGDSTTQITNDGNTTTIPFNVDLSLKAGWNRISQKLYYDNDDNIVKVVIDSKVVGTIYWGAILYKQ